MLQQYAIAPAEIKLINHGFNTTYRVTASGGERFALRINTNSHRSVQEMEAEVAWVSSLAAEFNGSADPTAPRFPTPVPCRTGSRLASAPSEPLGREVRAVLYRWLDGRACPDNVPTTIGRRMGDALRHLHRHAATFSFPSEAQLTPLDNSLFNRTYRLHEFAPELDHAALKAVAEEADRIMARQMALGPIPVHYDLHLGNVKWDGKRLAVFDFDDSMLGRPILDAAISIFYMRRSPKATEDAFWLGMLPTSKHPKLETLEAHGLTEHEFETLIASRAVGLANELFQMMTADLREIAPKYADAVDKRIANFHKTGIYNASIATL